MTPNSRNQFKRKHVSARGENLQEDLQSARVVKNYSKQIIVPDCPLLAVKKLEGTL